MQQRLLTRVVEWLIENIWQMAVLVVATYTLIQYQQGQLTKVEDLIAWLIAITELMAISGIIERNRKLNEIQKSISEFRKLDAKSNALRLYENRTQLPPLINDVESAQREIFIVGLALVSLTLTFLDVLKEKADKGCKIRIAMIAPRDKGQINPLILNLALTLGFQNDVANYVSSIEGSLNRLAAMKASLPKEKQKNIEIRIYNSVPTFVMMAFDGNTQNGKVRVDFIPYKVSRSLWPTFELRHDASSKIYEFVYQSSNQLWKDSVAWPLPVSPP